MDAGAEAKTLEVARQHVNDDLGPESWPAAACWISSSSVVLDHLSMSSDRCKLVHVRTEIVRATDRDESLQGGHVSFAMSRSEREAFLFDVHVGILSVNQPLHGPLAVPVWYLYEPGGPVSVIVPVDSRKARLMNESRRFRLCVQSEIPLYKYVSVECAITITEDPADPEERGTLAYRFLGQEGGDLFLEATAGRGETEVTYRTPELWFSADFNKLPG